MQDFPARVILSERSESNCEAVRGFAEQDLGQQKAKEKKRSRCFASPYGFDFGQTPSAQDDKKQKLAALNKASEASNLSAKAFQVNERVNFSARVILSERSESNCEAVRG